MMSGSAAVPASLKDNMKNAAPTAGLEEPIDIDAYEKSDAYNDVADDDRHAVNPYSIITPPNTLKTREGDWPAGSANPKLKHKYETRAAKNGRDATTLDKYDLKFHPADKHLRPKRAAKRRSGSEAPAMPTVDDDDELSDDSNASQSVANDSDSVELSEAESDESEPPVRRDPDPRAVRCSKRPAAQNFVNYSKKHHKDDYAIPGFQHKARELKQERKGCRPPVDAPKASQSKGKGGRKKRNATKAANLDEGSAPLVPTSDDTEGFVEGILSFVTSHGAEDHSSDANDDPMADLELLQEDLTFAQSGRLDESSSTMRGEAEFAGFSSELMIDEHGATSTTEEPSVDFVRNHSPVQPPVQGSRLPPDFEHMLEQALASDGQVIPNTSSDDV